MCPYFKVYVSYPNLAYLTLYGDGLYNSAGTRGWGCFLAECISHPLSETTITLQHRDVIVCDLQEDKHLSGQDVRHTGTLMLQVQVNVGSADLIKTSLQHTGLISSKHLNKLQYGYIPSLPITERN